MSSATHHALQIRDRLLRPANAVPDEGIDLSRPPNCILRDVAPASSEVVFAPIKPKPRPVDVEATLAAYPRIKIKPSSKKIVEWIIEIVAERYGHTSLALLTQCRTLALVKPRRAAMYMARKIANRPWTALGEQFRRDHTTVLHACRLVRDEMAADSAYAAEINNLEQLVRAKLAERGVPITRGDHHG